MIRTTSVNHSTVNMNCDQEAKNIASTPDATQHMLNMRVYEGQGLNIYSAY